jgi:hypothetical protein
VICDDVKLAKAARVHRPLDTQLKQAFVDFAFNPAQKCDHLLTPLAHALTRGPKQDEYADWCKSLVVAKPSPLFPVRGMFVLVAAPFAIATDADLGLTTWSDMLLALTASPVALAQATSTKELSGLGTRLLSKDDVTWPGRYLMANPSACGLPQNDPDPTFISALNPRVAIDQGLVHGCFKSNATVMQPTGPQQHQQLHTRVHMRVEGNA